MIKKVLSFLKKKENGQIPDRIHYGCGKTILPGWLNVDGFDMTSYPDGTIDPVIAGQIQTVDLSREHPFPDSYFRFGFAEDFLEHLDQPESLSFLCECYRTFRSGGVLRLSFPDLANVLKKHFLKSDYQGAAKAREEAYTMWNHKHFYCFESICLVSRHIGYREVKRVKFGKSPHRELESLERRRDQIDLNLIVEITK